MDASTLRSMRALFGQGGSIPSSCPGRMDARGSCLPKRHRQQLSGAKPRGTKVLWCTLPAWASSTSC